MPRDSRMSRLLHVLIHMDRHFERPTSDQISKMLGTNPVVVRRMLSGLKKAGIVTAERGQNGGWQLNRPLTKISLLDVYKAIGAPPFFNLGPGSQNPECLVEQAVDARIGETFAEAEALLKNRFAEVLVEHIAQDFEHKMVELDQSQDSAACDSQ